MSALMINVKIELAESHKEVELEKIVKGADGSLIMAIDMNDAINIDKCESAVLDVIYPSIRGTLTDHLSSVSEQLAMQQAGTTREVITNQTPYRVDGESGRFTFTTHSVFEEGKLQSVSFDFILNICYYLFIFKFERDRRMYVFSGC